MPRFLKYLKFMRCFFGVQLSADQSALKNYYILLEGQSVNIHFDTTLTEFAEISDLIWAFCASNDTPTLQ